MLVDEHLVTHVVPLRLEPDHISLAETEGDRPDDDRGRTAISQEESLVGDLDLGSNPVHDGSILAIKGHDQILFLLVIVVQAHAVQEPATEQTIGNDLILLLRPEHDVIDQSDIEQTFEVAGRIALRLLVVHLLPLVTVDTSATRLLALRLTAHVVLDLGGIGTMVAGHVICSSSAFVTESGW